MSLHVETPLLYSLELSTHCDKTVHLKMDVVQPAGSFKIRGIGHLCQQLASRGCTHFVSSSGGNAGYACAWSARQLGLRATIVVPESSPELIRRKLAALGAHVVVKGTHWAQADEHARSLLQGDSTAYVHPFDDPEIWQGHSSMIKECAAQYDGTPDCVIVSVGGGGNFIGAALGMDAVGWFQVPIVAVETLGCDSLAQSIAAGSHVTLPAITSVAKTLGATRVADEAWRVAQRRPVISVVVSDAQAVDACSSFLCDSRTLVEPSCGASLAALYAGVPELAAFNRVLVHVCGGNIISLQELQRLREAVGLPAQ